MNKELVENNYIVIKNFIEAERAAALYKEFKQHCDNNDLSGDHQVEKSQVEHNYIRFLELLAEKTPEVSKKVERTVLPTYAYARIYGNGATLRRHTDRDACEISLTIHLDGDAKWSIFIEKPDGQPTEVNLEPGDALLYFGCEAPHWREEFTGSYYGQVFLHYVDSTGDKSHSFFDNNNSVTPTTDSDKILKVSDFIKVFKNEIPASLCKRIIKEYKGTDEWLPGKVIDKDKPINNNTRNCEMIHMSYPSSINKNYKVRSKLDEELHTCMTRVIAKYVKQFPELDVSMDTGYDLLRYEDGQFYTKHVDDCKKHARVISCSISLNDGYDGGEFSFFDDELLIKAEAGSVIVFPSNFMYPHSVKKVIGNTRYAIVTWFK